ncbi:MAG: hypothetical protein KI792_10910 [Alphaproteobacteria bacterium]|nr:hypothetical protein [Alphaproteobacteria bacterium SS10]
MTTDAVISGDDLPVDRSTVRKPDARLRAPGFMRRLIEFIVRMVVGALLCLHPLGSLLIAGWLLRWARHRAIWLWAGLSPLPAADQAKAVMDMVPGWRAGRPPSWLIDERPRSELGSGIAKWFRKLTGALRQNLAAGLGATFNAWVLLLPGQILMLFSWWGGWENSFNKGYEQAWVGPTVALIGIAWFVPMAAYFSFSIGRQSVAGWRSCYDWHLNWRLMTQRPWLTVVIALIAVAAGAGYSALRFAPFFFPDSVAGFDEFTPEQLAEFARQFAWAALIYLLLVGIVLKQLAARFYAASLMDGLARGVFSIEELRPEERRILNTLSIKPEPIPAPTRWWWRMLVRFSGRVQRIILGAGVLAAWFGVIAQVYIAQFGNHNWMIWVNHPWLQLVWIPIPGGGG